MEERVMEADVLCIGGGIAGLMAAIRAGELGASVIVAEKGNALYSGSGAVGNDHFACYIPEVHGPDFRPVLEELRRGKIGGRLRDTHAARVWLETSTEIVKLWESWSIPMKYRGRYEFAGHSFPGHDSCNAWLKYEGRRQKEVLVDQALKRGVRIVNRVMIFELLGESGVSGALGVGTRADEMTVFKAKSIVMGTGTTIRLYPAMTPAWLFNTPRPGTLTGDGRAMAYRAGAELVNVEMFSHQAGPKYFARDGQATWVGVVRDPEGKAVGPFVTRPDRRYGDMVIELNEGLFEGYAQSGRGPLFMDCTGISDEDYDYMIHWFKNEGFEAFLNHLEQEKVDLKKNPVQFASYPMRVSGGNIRQGVKGETSLKGLYVAGDETTVGISHAATMAWIAGENAAKWAKEAESPETAAIREKIEKKKGLLNDLRGRKQGPDWEEVNIALQQIMRDYAGFVRSAPLLETGIGVLRRLREKARSTMAAKNQHELFRSLEVMNLLDLGEAVFIAAMERKETRGAHVRVDYPFANPLLDKILTIKKVGGKPVLGWRERSH